MNKNHYENGFDAGTASGSWVFDGNTDTATYARILNAYNEGDPGMDICPAALSGEWAGESMTELLGDDADDITAQEEYECGFTEGFWAEVTRAAQAHLSD
jgi:hypothetical protein